MEKSKRFKEAKRLPAQYQAQCFFGSTGWSPENFLMRSASISCAPRRCRDRAQFFMRDL